MRILTFSEFYLPGYKGGGPIKTVKNLFDTSSSESLKYLLVTSDRDLGDESPYQTVKQGRWNRSGKVKAFYTSPSIMGGCQIFSILCNKQYDIVYVNSFFSFRFSILPQLLSKILKKKVIVGPRGELSLSALQISSFKKRVYIYFYKLLGLKNSLVFQASSDYEAKDIRNALGRDVNVYIAEDIGAQEFARNVAISKGEVTRIVFISRISSMKNIMHALEVLAQVSVPTCLDIYGPIEDVAYWDSCCLMIEQLPQHVSVSYKGTLRPEKVVTTLSQYDLFFLPSLGENYGHVIAEALCAGLPILISDRTPWRGLQEIGIGWDLPLSAQNSFVQVINDYGLQTDKEYSLRRNNVLNWARNKFSQRQAVDSNIEMFQYVLNESRKK